MDKQLAVCMNGRVGIVEGTKEEDDGRIRHYGRGLFNEDRQWSSINPRFLSAKETQRMTALKQIGEELF